MLKIGLLINPWAGVGGSVALKGSDGEAVREKAMALGASQRAVQRTQRCFQRLEAQAGQVQIACWGGAMGADALIDTGLAYTVHGQPAADPSGPGDTQRAARALAALDIDVLVFTGGDGTARDVLDAVGSEVPSLGIPSGVKMHSGVYAVSPEAAGDLLCELARAGLVNLQLREVRDIDETAFREGVVRAQFYGELLTPEEGRFLQHTKISGVESQELVAEDIAADIVEGLRDDTLYLLGPGSTTAAIPAALGEEGTLLGVDLLQGGALVGRDLTANMLLDAVAAHEGPAQIIVTAIGGQGHVFGRGNQQFSPELIRAVGVDNICVVAGKGKLSGLEGRPLLVDTNDPELDAELCGYRRVITGYHDEVLYPLAVSP